MGFKKFDHGQEMENFLNFYKFYKTVPNMPESKNSILSLPIFKDLSDETTHHLYKNATIKKLKKGTTLFLESDVPDKLYIILEGWIKLYKGTIEGEETIIQMLTEGDMVAESAIFLNARYPISAQVAKTAVVVSLPVTIVREQLKASNNFALNMLNGISLHSQILIQGLENIRLKPVTERVGWFLLKLLVEQDKVPDMVELPYDKSIIASYLDMKPETFSRTLKKFSQIGFEINNKSIIIPAANALCGFCDTDIAMACSRHGTPDCPNPDCVPSDILKMTSNNIPIC